MDAGYAWMLKLEVDYVIVSPEKFRRLSTPYNPPCVHAAHGQPGVVRADLGWLPVRMVPRLAALRHSLLYYYTLHFAARKYAFPIVVCQTAPSAAVRPPSHHVLT